MTANGKPVVVYCTFPDRATALRIAGALVDEGLAACVNVLGEITSVYVWEGARHEEAEVAAIVKTVAARADAVVAFVKARHPFTNPAILVVPITGGSAEFLAWIAEGTAQGGGGEAG